MARVLACRMERIELAYIKMLRNYHTYQQIGCTELMKNFSMMVNIFPSSFKNQYKDSKAKNDYWVLWHLFFQLISKKFRKEHGLDKVY